MIGVRRTIDVVSRPSCTEHWHCERASADNHVKWLTSISMDGLHLNAASRLHPFLMVRLAAPRSHELQLEALSLDTRVQLASEKPFYHL